MRIEKLLPPPQPGKPWSVALEGGEVLRVSESVVASFALYGGMELEAETLTALQEAAALAAWREKAGRLLTARMLSSGQLAEKLTAKGATEEQAAQVVAWAQDIITPPRATAPIKSKTNSTAAKSPERIGRRPWRRWNRRRPGYRTFCPGRSRTRRTLPRSRKPQTPWCAGAFPGIPRPRR